MSVLAIQINIRLLHTTLLSEQSAALTLVFGLESIWQLGGSQDSARRLVPPVAVPKRS